jgi:hypothetical protein
MYSFVAVEATLSLPILLGSLRWTTRLPNSRDGVLGFRSRLGFGLADS